MYTSETNNLLALKRNISDSLTKTQINDLLNLKRNITDINWEDISESGPAVLAMITMPLTYSISHGIALAFIAYALIKIFTGQ